MGEHEKPKQPTALEKRLAEEQAKVDGYDEVVEVLEEALEDARELRDEHQRSVDLIKTWRYAGPPEDPEL